MAVRLEEAGVAPASYRTIERRFTEVEQFHAWHAEQWSGLRLPATPSG
jgi:hypothetical protein